MLDHLSYSSINTYLMCPRNWRFHYIDKEPAKESTNLVFGSAFHETIEAYIGMQTVGRSPNLLSIWKECLWMELTREDTETMIDFQNETPESLENEGIRILSAIEGQLADIIPLKHKDNDGLMIEHFVSLTVPGVPIPIIGYIDIITADGVPGDFKTSSRSWNPSKALNEMQPLFYLAALNQEGFDLNPNHKFKHYIFTKTKNPRLDIIETQRTLGEMFFLFEMIRDVWQAIEAEIFPTRPNTWKCSEKWCDFWNICRGKTL